MADYYTELSFEITLPNPEQVPAAAARMRELAEAVLEGLPVPDILETFAGEDAGVEIKGEYGRISVCDNDSAHTDLVASLVQQILREFDPAGAVGYEWSYTCTKPVAGGFGGGAAWVTADEVQIHGTSDWLHAREEAWQLSKGP